MGPRAGLDGFGNSRPLPGFDPRAFQLLIPTELYRLLAAERSLLNILEGSKSVGLKYNYIPPVALNVLPVRLVTICLYRSSGCVGKAITWTV